MPKEHSSYQLGPSISYGTGSVFPEYNPFAASYLHSEDPDEDADHLLQPVQIEPQLEVEPSNKVVVLVKENLPQAA